MEPLHLTVCDLTGMGGSRPVTGGVPLPQGAAPAATDFALATADGQPVALQTQILARWKDGSARWVLLDFAGVIPAAGRAEFVLTADRVPGPAASFNGVAITACSERGVLALGDELRVALELTLDSGESGAAVATTVALECAGPLRRTLALRGDFLTPSGRRVFQFRLRASAYTGSSRVRLEPLILIDAETGVIQKVRSLDLVLRPRVAPQGCRLGGTPGWAGSPAAGVRLFQRDDETSELQGAPGVGGKAPGWAEMTVDGRPVAVAVRDFWQQWPKSLEASAEGLRVGLFPHFTAGDFDHMEPWYKHGYLFEGNCYRLRTGQSRRWDLWVDIAGSGADLAALANAPAVLSPAPAQALATGVWDDIAPAGVPEMAEYDPWTANLYQAYCESIRHERDYGAMNWGDWFGERQVNWGNHEYDTVNQLLIQFARTGDPTYFHSAEAAARHSAEVDVVHHVNPDLAAHFAAHWSVKGYPARPGMVHEHSVGHVGSFYSVETVRKLFVEHRIGDSDHPYLCLDPFNLGHIWTQGLVKYYFLSGDAFARETVECIGDNLARLVEDGVYDFGIEDPHFGRAAGWPLLAMAGAYELDFDERYLKAMRNLADRALARQDPHCGGWLYQLYPGHCYCTTRKHVGMAGFITAILVNGLSRYGQLTGDERIPPAVQRAVTFLNHDTWIEPRCGWRYTSCPASAFTGQYGVTVMALVNAIRLAGDPEHLRILRLAWQAKFEALKNAPPPGPGQGKAYTGTIYGCPEAAGLLASRRDGQS
jgi:hypothetical protein